MAEFQYRVVWQNSKKPGKVFKGNWLTKEQLENWKRDSSKTLKSNITFEIQKRQVK